MSSSLNVRRPKFRLFAAAAMIGFIVLAAGSVGVAVLVAVRSLAMSFGWIEALPRNSGTSHQWWVTVWSFPTWQLFLVLTGFAVAMLSMAFLLRKVVLSGLRD